MISYLEMVEEAAGKDNTYRFNKGNISLVTGKKDDDHGTANIKPPRMNCLLCNGLHGVRQ